VEATPGSRHVQTGKANKEQSPYAFPAPGDCKRAGNDRSWYEMNQERLNGLDNAKALAKNVESEYSQEPNKEDRQGSWNPVESRPCAEREHG
jgi:hypothetical protein